jgi:phosphoribosylamine--glycine ligase
MEGVAKPVPIGHDAVERLLIFAQDRGIDLTVVGPEIPLALGLVDRFEENGLPVFGPRRAAAEIETNKAFAKAFMQRHHIPTASFEIVTLEEARRRAPSLPMPIVLKAAGLAAGKGVVVARHPDDALQALDDFGNLGDAATQILLEQCLTGPEVSFFVVTDGESVIPLTTAQDHKTIFDGNRGPNTGGMGAICPAPNITPALQDEIMSTIILPTIRGLAAEGRPYTGVLYAGLMLTPSGPSVLEFNARFGDPEAQAILFRMETDWVSVMEAALDHRLGECKLAWNSETAICVVLAAHGYPGRYRKEDVIIGLDAVASMPDVMVYHAGTDRREQTWVTQGGRVLGVTARGRHAREARRLVYQAVEKISFLGMQYRRDIGTTAQ